MRAQIKYYNNNLFYNVQSGLLAQCGDPTGTGKVGGWVLLECSPCCEKRAPVDLQGCCMWTAQALWLLLLRSIQGGTSVYGLCYGDQVIPPASRASAIIRHRTFEHKLSR